MVRYFFERMSFAFLALLIVGCDGAVSKVAVSEPSLLQPKVANILPQSAITGTRTHFTVSGEHLPDDTLLAIDDCDDLQRVHPGTAAARLYSCVPVKAGEKTARVLLGSLELSQLAERVITFSDPAAPQPTDGGSGVPPPSSGGNGGDSSPPPSGTPPTGSGDSSSGTPPPSSGGDSSSGTPPPSSGGDSSSGTPPPSSGGDSSSGTPPPSSGGDSSSGTPPPSSGGDSSSGTPPPSSGGDSSSGTPPPSSGGDSSSGTPPPSSGPALPFRLDQLLIKFGDYEKGHRYPTLVQIADNQVLMIWTQLPKDADNDIKAARVVKALLTYDPNSNSIKTSQYGVLFAPKPDRTAVDTTAVRLEGGPHHGRLVALIGSTNHALTDGLENLRTYLTTSDDNGLSWSTPSYIDSLNAETPSGAGIATPVGPRMFQTTYGAVKNRLVTSVFYSFPNGKKRGRVIYSDDWGASWQYGADYPQADSMEHSVVETPSGKLIFFSRIDDYGQQSDSNPDYSYRHVAISHDSGISFSSSYFDKRLPDPRVNNGSLQTERVNQQGVKEFLTMTTHHDNTNRSVGVIGRVKLTIKVSADEGQTWQSSYKIPKDDTQFTGYTAIEKLNADYFIVVYETSPNNGNNGASLSAAIVNLAEIEKK